ncbi:hypothetical protein DWU98_13690 [Dyella monticola]|uniref:DUF2884 family protein n=1 Tax=Dyella monticola TaxID=1927958 RepID=A0A370WWR7_9GAMM|nr:hypothetical protein [Dyella monticola]RDS80467.1 hypothetical protein DWU98_13690 [Dyella monticola]
MNSISTRCLATAIMALCGMLAGCNHSDPHEITIIQSGGHITSIDSDMTDLSHGSIQFAQDHVTVHTGNAPDAVIHGNGDLEIDQRPVTVDAASRTLLKTYYSNALTIRSDAIATGKAGVAVGEQAAKSVLKRLASGHPSEIQHDIDAKTSLVKADAAKICQDLRLTKQSQDQLATSLPAFKPYGAVVGDDDIDECTKDSQE